MALGFSPMGAALKAGGSIAGPAARAAGRAPSLAGRFWGRSSCSVPLEMF